MSSVNPLTREILLKIVYCGPGLGGKTTTLKHIHETARPEHRGKLVSLATPVDRTLYFDFLPVRLAKVGGYTLRLQLFTVPGQVYYNATRKLVLTGADGVVMVFDSQISRMDANLESLGNLKDNLAERQIDFDAFPVTFHYNKRDIDDVCSIAELQNQLNPQERRRFVETCAVSGEGVYSGLELITKEVLNDLKRRNVLTLKPKEPTERLKRAMEFSKDDQGISQTVRKLSENTGPARTTWQPPAPRDLGRRPYRSYLPGRARSEAPPFAEIVPEEQSRATPQSRSSLPGPVMGPVMKPDRPTMPAPPSEPSPLRHSRQALPSHAFSFASLWPQADRDRIYAIEDALSQGRNRDAIEAVWKELKNQIAAAGEGLADKPPTEIVSLLGLNGRRYLKIARLAREVASGYDVSREAALQAYAFLLQAIIVSSA